MSKDIERWLRALTKRGFSNTVNPAHWGDKWAERKWMTVDAACTILEITQANEYINIVERQDDSGKRFFLLSRYVRTDCPQFPKTYYYTKPYVPERCSKSQIWRRCIRR